MHHSYILLRQSQVHCVLLQLPIWSHRNGRPQTLQSLSHCKCLLLDLHGLALSLHNLSRFVPFGDVDFALALALTEQNLAALVSLGLGLQLHATLDHSGRLNVLNLVAEHLDAPVLGGQVQRPHDVCVERLTLLEGAVQVKAADLRAHAGLSKRGNSNHGVSDVVGGLFCVDNLVVEKAVDLDFDVVLRDGSLVLNVVQGFLKTVAVGHGAQEGQLEVKAWLGDVAEPAQVLYDGPVVVLDEEKGRG